MHMRSVQFVIETLESSVQAQLRKQEFKEDSQLFCTQHTVHTQAVFNPESLQSKGCRNMRNFY